MAAMAWGGSWQLETLGVAGPSQLELLVLPSTVLTDGSWSQEPELGLKPAYSMWDQEAPTTHKIKYTHTHIYMYIYTLVLFATCLNTPLGIDNN